MWIDALLMAGSVIAAFLVQTAVLPAAGVVQVSPEIILALVIVFGAFWRPVPCALVAVGIGLIMDIMFGRGIGAYALSYLIAGWVAPYIAQQFPMRAAAATAIYAGLFFLARQALMLFLLFLVGVEWPITGTLMGNECLSGLLTAIVTFGLYFPLRRWFAWRSDRASRYSIPPGLR